MKITDEQIETLRSEAARAGDTLQVALCDVALANGLTDMVEVGEHRAELETLGVVPEHIDADVRARELCTKAIADAQAQTALEEQWWAWHDEDYDRTYATMQEAEAACAAWVRGESDVGPDRDCDDERCFRPTHTIVLESQDGHREEIPVKLVDGAAYTREEWDAEVPADWTYDEERGWLFLGDPCPTVFSNVHVGEQ
jgi:hypothetical protein